MLDNLSWVYNKSLLQIIQVKNSLETVDALFRKNLLIFVSFAIFKIISQMKVNLEGIRAYIQLLYSVNLRDVFIITENLNKLNGFTYGRLFVFKNADHSLSQFLNRGIACQFGKLGKKHGKLLIKKPLHLEQFAGDLVKKVLKKR